MAGVGKIFDFAKQFSPVGIAYDAIKNKKMPDIPFSPIGAISSIARGKVPQGGAIGFANTLISGGKKAKKKGKGKGSIDIETGGGGPIDKTYG